MIQSKDLIIRYSKDFKFILKEMYENMQDEIMKGTLEKRNEILLTINLLKSIAKEMIRKDLDKIFVKRIRDEIFKDKNVLNAYSMILIEIDKLGNFKNYQRKNISLLILSAPFSNDGYVTSINYKRFAKKYCLDRNEFLNSNLKWYLSLIIPTEYAYSNLFWDMEIYLNNEVYGRRK